MHGRERRARQTIHLNILTFAVTILVLALAPLAHGQTAKCGVDFGNCRQLPGGRVAALLQDGHGTGYTYDAKYGRRSVRIESRLNNIGFEARFELWTLMGEPIEIYEFRAPKITNMFLHGDAGYRNSVAIYTVGDSEGKGYIDAHFQESWPNVTIHVSEDVLDLVRYHDFTFSITVLPLGSGTHYGYLYIHRRNPGVIDRPGQWGWDVPGSPDWDNFLSRVDAPLDEREYEVPTHMRASAEVARDVFRSDAGERSIWRPGDTEYPGVADRSAVFHLQAQAGGVCQDRGA